MSISRRQLLQLSTFTTIALALEGKSLALTPLEAAISQPNPSITHPTERALRDTFVAITSPTTMPKDQDVVIAWKTADADILGFEIRIGTIAGQWDVFSSRLGKDLREIRLPGLPQNMTPLFVEFGYVVSSSATKQGHESTENVLLNEEPFEITRV